jgi:hypothetical protein
MRIFAEFKLCQNRSNGYTLLTGSDQLMLPKSPGAIMRRTKFLTTGLPRCAGLQTPDVPVSQSDHNQLRGLPNLQRIALSIV